MLNQILILKKDLWAQHSRFVCPPETRNKDQKNITMSNEKKLILIADDDADYLFQMETMVKKPGFSR